MEVNDGLLLTIVLVDLHGLTNVNIGRSNDEIVQRHDREFDLISLIEIGKVDIGAELLRHHECFAAKLDVCLLIGLVKIVAFTALAIACRNRWMVSHLFCQILKVIRDELECLTEKRIEWLSSCSLADSQSSDDMDSDKSMSSNRILFFGCEI